MVFVDKISVISIVLYIIGMSWLSVLVIRDTTSCFIIVNGNKSTNQATISRTMPAPIVSPPRRIKIRPMSLLQEKGSNGIGRTVERDPDVAKARNEICTSADMPFVRTRGFCLIAVPDARSRVVTSFEIVAGTSRE